MQQEKKADKDVAAALKQVELTEQLTVSTKNSLLGAGRGPLSTEQIFILEARSADLQPPASDIPANQVPDEDLKKVILDRADSYINRTYEMLPPLIATKTTLRFQDSSEAVAQNSGIGSGAKDAVTASGFTTPANYTHYINAATRDVVLDKGTERKHTEGGAKLWGANGQIQIQTPGPNLGAVFKAAQASGTLRWLRWESIGGKPAAVFLFNVTQQKARLDLDVCCFPNVKQAGVARFYSSTAGREAAGMEASSGGGGGGVAGNFQTNTEWKDFRKSVPYHGRLFIDPDTGTVMRMIVEAEMKPSDVVHQLDTRVDYGPVKVGVNSYVLPVRSFTNSIVVPNGESGAGGYSTRITVFASEYSEYRQGVAR